MGFWIKWEEKGVIYLVSLDYKKQTMIDNRSTQSTHLSLLDRVDSDI